MAIHRQWPEWWCWQIYVELPAQHFLGQNPYSITSMLFDAAFFLPCFGLGFFPQVGFYMSIWRVFWLQLSCTLAFSIIGYCVAFGAKSFQCNKMLDRMTFLNTNCVNLIKENNGGKLISGWKCSVMLLVMRLFHILITTKPVSYLKWYILSLVLEADVVNVLLSGWSDG